jgi:diguanylate cyclase (GGDEF)-like protein
LSFSLFLAFYSKDVWQPWQSLFFSIFALLTVIGAIFSAQFSQSRFSILLFISFSFYMCNQLNFTWLNFWNINEDFQLISALFIFIYLSFAKDRALLSIHIVYRVLGIILCIVTAFGWLNGIDWLQQNVNHQPWLINLFSWCDIELPIAITLCLLFVRSVVTSQLLQGALLNSALVYCLAYFSYLPLPWLGLLMSLSAYYVLSIIVSTYFLAYRDELTSLPSRRALYQKSLSLGRKYSVAMMDIDHFKKFNDTYGHDVGDQVLKLVAAKLAKVKNGGHVFRYGGEEFTVIFPRKIAEQTLDELEKVRQSIADYSIAIRRPERKGKSARKTSKRSNMTTVSVTISIGVATREHKQSFDQVMKQADVKLYQAKSNGRNNVTA